MRRGKLRRLEIARSALGAMLLLAAVIGLGCNRAHYRRQADREVYDILGEKDRIETWKIGQFHVYPDPRARFADGTNPDRPPMPPDDPVARLLAPNPQRPGKGGVAWVEGTGYLNLLAFWDEQNRTEKLLDETIKKFSDVAPGDLRQASLTVQTDDKPYPYPDPLKEPISGVTRPYLLKLEQAVELGIINSREFQNRREDLYLSALPVTLERFAFSTQFFAFEEAVRQRSGSDSVSGYGNFWQANSTLGFSKLFSTGALLLASFANQTAVNLTGADRHTLSVSEVNLDLIQPLLRGGGRAVTLEPLTQAERNLLYEIRSYARFRKEYFQYITGGGVLSEFGFGASIRSAGISIGSVSLGSGNPASLSLRPGGAGRLDLARGTIAPAAGYLPTLLLKAFLINDRKNVEALAEYEVYFETLIEGGVYSKLQLDQVVLQKLQGEATVLRDEQNLQDSLDQLKLQLGVPVNIDIDLDDAAIKPVTSRLDMFDKLIDQSKRIAKMVETLAEKMRGPNLRKELYRLLTDSEFVAGAKRFRAEFPDRWREWEKLDDKTLAMELKSRSAERDALQRKKKDEAAKFTADEEEKLNRLERSIKAGELEDGLRLFEAATRPGKEAPEEIRRKVAKAVADRFQAVYVEAGNELLESIRQSWPELPSIVVEGVDLLKGEMPAAYEAVTRTALSNRLDLMNARAQVVDTWRQVAIFANSLLGAVNVGYHVDSITPSGEAKPLAFSGKRTRHQVFLNAELPLVRLAERNAYRASLIAYQRARRELMSLEDQIVAQVRQELRQLRVFARTFDIQKQRVALSYLQVVNSLAQVQAPPDPDRRGGSADAASLTQQLLNAQRSLPQDQNQLLSIWINFQIQRQQLFLDLELMPLDYRGVWIDELSHRQPLDCEPGDRLPGRGANPDGDLERQRASLLPPA